MSGRKLAAEISGRPAREVITDLVPPEQVAAAVRRYSVIAERQTDGVVALPGGYEALTATATCTAIVSSCSRAVATARLTAAGLTPPDTMVTVEDVTRGKPDPEPFLLGARRLGVDSGRCLAVEDTPAGLVSARAAGCATPGVGTTFDRARLDGDGVVPDLSHVRFVRQGGQLILTDRVALGAGAPPR